MATGVLVCKHWRKVLLNIHMTSINNFKIIGREENSLAKTIQEAMFIRVNNPTLNKNI